MAIKVLSTESKEEIVNVELIVSTIEKNRDRIRTTSSMVITTTGILISACLGIVLFTTDKKLITKPMTWCFVIGMISFLFAATMGVLSSVLRTNYRISNEAQFVSDLLKVFHSELRLSRVGLSMLLFGLVATVCGVLSRIVR